MTTLTELATTLQTLLTTTADQVARATGFVRRASPLTGARWVQTVVFGWLADPQASLEALAQTAALVGAPVSAQALDQRWGPAAAACLQQVLGHALRQVVQADPVAIPLLRRFTGVRILDSTTVVLPAALAEVWPGCGGGCQAEATQAAVKFQVEWDLVTGALTSLSVHAGRESDQEAPCQRHRPPPGTLCLADLGYFDLEKLRALSAGGCWWLRRLPVAVAVGTADGPPIAALARWLERHRRDRIDAAVWLGAQQRLPARLLAVRAPAAVVRARRARLRREARRKGRPVNPQRWALAAWTVWVTNLPAAALTLTEALVLGRARWQIELLFKLWKEHGRLDESRSAKPWRIACEVLAKLLGLVVQHWVLLVSCWQVPNRSLRKAAAAVRHQAVALAAALPSVSRLVAAVAAVAVCLRRGCRINRRRAKPHTWQLLLEPELLWTTYT